MSLYHAVSSTLVIVEARDCRAALLYCALFMCDIVLYSSSVDSGRIRKEKASVLNVVFEIKVLLCLVIAVITLSCRSPAPTATSIPPAVVSTVHAPISPLVPRSDSNGTFSETPNRSLQPSTPDRSDWPIYRSEYPGDWVQFEVRYDPRVWSLVDEQTEHVRLAHREIQKCSVRLMSYSTEVSAFYGTVHLAGIEWNLAASRKTLLHYSTLTPEQLSFIINVELPEEFSPAHKSLCQSAAEVVIDTFMVAAE